MQPHWLVLDLSALSFIDSAGLAACLPRTGAPSATAVASRSSRARARCAGSSR